jgi:hypothetical protein
MSEFYYLRNVRSSGSRLNGDGRLSYRRNLSSRQVWATPDTRDTHILAIYGYQPNFWVIYAWETYQRTGLPEDRPLRLRLEMDGTVKLGTMFGPCGEVRDAEPFTFYWVPEIYTGFNDPRDTSSTPGKIDFVRLSPAGRPGYYLGLDVECNPLHQCVPRTDLPLVVRNQPAEPGGNDPYGVEWWWIMEPASRDAEPFAPPMHNEAALA